MKKIIVFYTLLAVLVAGKASLTLASRLSRIDDGQQASAIKREVQQLTQEKMILTTQVADAASIQHVVGSEVGTHFTAISKPLVLHGQTTLALLQ